METDPSTQAIKEAWRNQEMEQFVIQLMTVKSASDTFDRRVLNRNRREYLACVVVVILFGLMAWRADGWMIQFGAIMVITGTFYIAWHLHRHGSAGKARPAVSAQSLTEYHRGELVRQRDLLRSVWRWYLAPMVPGMVMIMLGRWFQDHVAGRSIADDHHKIIGASIFVVIIFIGGGLLNSWAASRLQTKIDELDRLSGE